MFKIAEELMQKIEAALQVKQPVTATGPVFMAGCMPCGGNCYNTCAGSCKGTCTATCQRNAR